MPKPSEHIERIVADLIHNNSGLSFGEARIQAIIKYLDEQADATKTVTDIAMHLRKQVDEFPKN